MASYCKQCSESHFGTDYEDFAGIARDIVLKPNEGFHALCEGCGPVLVDHEGKRIDPEKWRSYDDHEEEAK